MSEKKVAKKKARTDKKAVKKKARADKKVVKKKTRDKKKKLRKETKADKKDVRKKKRADLKKARKSGASRSEKKKMKQKKRKDISKIKDKKKKDKSNIKQKKRKDISKIKDKKKKDISRIKIKKVEAIDDINEELAIALAKLGTSKKFVESLWKKLRELSKRFEVTGSNRSLSHLVEQFPKDTLKMARIEAGLFNYYRSQQWTKNVFNHPRRLSFARKTGSLIGPLNRTWIHPIPYTHNKVEFVFKKRDGKGKAMVTFGKFVPGKKEKVLWAFTVDPGDKNKGEVWKKTFSNVSGSILVAAVDGKSVANKINYEIRIKYPNQGSITIPKKKSSKSVEGFADIHAHHMSYLGFGGNLIYPNPFGRLDSDTSCTGLNHGRMRPGLKKVKSFSWSGIHTNRTKHPKDWPHHLDMIHQTMHADHLKMAVDGGLRLLVLPAVSNMFLSHLALNHDKNVPLNDMDNVRLQLRAAHAFAEKYPWYCIAHDPWEAREIIRQGKLAVILSVEVGHLMPDTHGNWEDQLDELYDLGVRTMQIVHETDSDFAGAAHHHGFKFWIARSLKSIGKDISDSPLKFAGSSLTSILTGNLKPLAPYLSSVKPPEKVSIEKAHEDKLLPYKLKVELPSKNLLGLTIRGKKLLRKIANKRMVLEIDHCSRKARKDIHDFLISASSSELRHYPYNFTHTRFDSLIPSQKNLEKQMGMAKPSGHVPEWDSKEITMEYMVTDKEVTKLMQVGGLFGIRTGPTPMKKYSKGTIKNTCHTSTRSLAQIVMKAQQEYGLALSLGSDINAYAPTTGARFDAKEAGATFEKGVKKNNKWMRVASGLPNQTADKKENGESLSEFDVSGLKHIGYEPDLIKDLENLGLSVNAMSNSAESFLRMWERCYDKNRTSMSPKQYWNKYSIPTNERPSS